MKTLKELRQKYPEHIKTSGNLYYIDGMGWYRQQKSMFGIETFTKNWKDEWTGVSFDKLVEYVAQLFK